MSNASYAPSGSGPYAGAIGWVNFSGVLSSGSSMPVIATLKDGSTVTFTVSNIYVSGGTPNFIGVTAPINPSYPFGGAGYAGLSGPVILYTQASSVYACTIRFSNIVVRDPNGVIIPNYTIVICDGEITGSTESMHYITNGGSWYSLGQLGSGATPAYSGFGTNTVNLISTGATSYKSVVCATDSPSSIDVNIDEGTVPGYEGIAFGVVLTKVNVSKVVNARAFLSDQFQFSVATPTITYTTITTGYANGVQPQSIYYYLQPGTTANTTYTVNEIMATGSRSTLSTFSPSVFNSNATPGGSPLPSTSSLGQSINMAFGDYVVSTIVNTATISYVIPNNANATFNYIVDPTLGTTASGTANSNTVASQLNFASLSNTVKSTDKSFADVGSVLTYTVAMTNNGNASANNVIFIDTIPNGTSIVSGSLTLNGGAIGGSPNPPGVNIGSIPSGSTSTVSFKVIVNTIPSPNPIVNSANTTFNFIVDPTLGTTGNGSSNSNIVNNKVNNANLGNLIKTSDKTFVDVGTTITYTVSMTNSGSTTANNVMFIDTIPNGTSIVAGSLTLNGGTIGGSPNPPGASIGAIAAGATATVSFKVLVYTIPSPNPIVNSASTTFSYIIDPTLGTTGNGSSNSNTVTNQVNNANLSNIVKTTDKPFADVGTTITYTVSMKNSGSITANNVMFIDTIPNGTSIVAGSLTLNGGAIGGSPNPPGVNIGAIGAGTTSTVSFKVVVNTIPSPNPIVNSASTTFSYIIDPTLGTTGNSGSNSNTITSQVNNANLSNIIKTSDKPFIDVGTTITYTVSMKNSGSTTANNVMFIDTIPAGTSIVAGSLTLNGGAIGGNPNPPGVNIGSIGAGTTSTVSFKVVVYTIPVSNSIANSASTTFSYIVDPTLGTTGNSGSNSNTITSQVNNANLSSISKYADLSYVSCGDIISYTITIPNSGNVTAINVYLHETIPSGTIYVANSLKVNGSPSSDSITNINVGTIGPGSASTVSFSVKVNC